MVLLGVVFFEKFRFRDVLSDFILRFLRSAYSMQALLLLSLNENVGVHPSFSTLGIINASIASALA